MTIGGSIALLVIGAILRYAINWSSAYVDLRLVGLILMIAGAAGLIIALTLLVMRRQRASASRTEVYEQRHYTESPRATTSRRRITTSRPRATTSRQQGYNQPPQGYDQPAQGYDQPPPGLQPAADRGIRGAPLQRAAVLTGVLFLPDRAGQLGIDQVPERVELLVHSSSRCSALRPARTAWHCPGGGAGPA